MVLTLRSPLSGRTSPMSILSRVVLPAPFGPTSPMRSLSSTLMVTFLRTSLGPKDFEIPSARMSMGVPNALAVFGFHRR